MLGSGPPAAGGLAFAKSAMTAKPNPTAEKPKAKKDPFADLLG
jgi:hypothetical protein